MNYEKIKRITLLCEIGQKIMDNTEFVEIRIGSENVGGLNFRIKGNTVYSNIPELPAFQFNLPPDLVTKGKQYLTLLKQYLATETTT